MGRKKFKHFGKVLYKSERDKKWHCRYYDQWDEGSQLHLLTDDSKILDSNILPYEGNEHLVGTTDEPDEEIFINYGTELMAMTKNKNWIYATLVSTHCIDNYFTVALSNGEDIRVFEICRFSDFNPSNMEETKKHILVVKNGRIIRYKG